ncbi:hypothetical protein BV881_28110 [Streptomyces sp. ZL-24]|uniref:hypothetical protein n=1 Tax=Streptomyces sp. ZL-24 TaxID=1933029 RepID=UPI000CD406CA|nr:hypothetical protein [Streptomyces sp. ZL-24]POG44203.1 hypothetical protein BV881_28110 [Streptomyces sp. ZL-24]
MIMLSVDPVSRSYADGQAVGQLLGLAVLLVVVWVATQAWRRGPAPDGPDDVERTTAIAVRRGNIVRGALLFIAAAGLIGVFTGKGYQPAAEAAPSAQEPVAQSPSAATGPAAIKRVIDAAPRVGEYRLHTGAEAAEYERLAPGKPGQGKRWFYDGPGKGSVDALLQINATEWDASLPATSSPEAMWDELLELFAGAGASQVTDFEAGPWGGQLGCGFVTTDGGRQILCAWIDSDTRGQLGLLDEGGLPRAAKIALEFRTASEKRADQ